MISLAMAGTRKRNLTYNREGQNLVSPPSYLDITNYCVISRIYKLLGDSFLEENVVKRIVFVLSRTLVSFFQKSNKYWGLFLKYP